jgi:iron complex transport system substrate-binding protein
MIARIGRWPGRIDFEHPSFVRFLLVTCIFCTSGCDGALDAVEEPAAGQPARRIITLAPHLTELVFTAGAGNRLVGVVEYSDYPPESRLLPRVGDAFRLDYEAIAALKPDLILGWQSGTPVAVLDRLTELGYRVLTLEPGRLTTIAEHLRFIGQLADSAPAAATAAAEYERDLEELRGKHKNASTLSVFYQISWQPLFTINKRHVIGEAIEICGGRNIFAELTDLSPAISLEAVLEQAPQVIVASQFDSRQKLAETQLASWSKWKNIPAVRDGNLFLLDADLLARPSTRILGGVRALCDALDAVRGRSPANDSVRQINNE